MCRSQIVVRSGRYVIRQHLFAPKWRAVEECDGFTVWQNSASVESEYAVSEPWAVYPAADETEFSCASVQTARARARFLAKCVRERKFPKAAKPKAVKSAKASKPKGEKKPSQQALFAGELAEVKAAQVRLLAELDQVRAELAESRENRKSRKAKV
jgi:hypothetical protein